MSPRAVAPGLAALFLLSTGLAAPRNVSAWSHDPHQAVRVAAAPGNQVADAALSDGAGGAYVFFEDSRSGNVDVYAQHVRWDGSLDPAWPPSGLPLCTATGDQTAIRAASDDAGGAYVCWLDNRSGVPKPYGTRVLPGGTIAAGFPANGQLLDTVTPAAQADGAPQICDSGTGLAAIVWTTQVLATNNDLYGTTLYPSAYSSWCLGLVTTASNQASPVIANEGGVFDLVWCEGGSAIDAARFSWGGSQFGSTQVLSNAAYVNTDPRIAPSGQGGTIVAWSAYNGAGYAPCASSFFGGIAWTNFGNIAPFVNANLYLGALVDAGNYQDWLVWAQGNASQTIYLQTLNRYTAGAVMALDTQGDAVTTRPVLAPDGAGDVVAAYSDRTNPESARALRVMSNGAVPPLWPAPPSSGTLASAGVVGRVTNATVPDGSGGAIVFANDVGLFPSQIYATHIDRWGAYDGEPSGVSVRDVPNDQGGNVRVSWNASYLDLPYAGSVGSYWLWRQVPAALAQALAARGAALYRADAIDAPRAGTLRFETTATGASIAWEFVASQVADGFSAYSMATTTLGDSTPSGNPKTIFMVEARASAAAIGWPSQPDSGYSVDNLAPLAPAPFAGQYVAGAAQLHWGPNRESDLAGYRLYRGTTSTFTPGPASLVAALADTVYTDVAGAPYWYKLTAVDVHGNESLATTLEPAGTAGVGGSPASLAFTLASANPARGGAVLRLDLPAAGRVRVGLYDVSGRGVRTLADGDFGAGSYPLAWDGRDAAGNALPGGLYFARLETRGTAIVRRIVLER